jgi:hypothetical protein
MAPSLELLQIPPFPLPASATLSLVFLEKKLEVCPWGFYCGVEVVPNNYERSLYSRIQNRNLIVLMLKHLWKNSNEELIH